MSLTFSAVSQLGNLDDFPPFENPPSILDENPPSILEFPNYFPSVSSLTGSLGSGDNSTSIDGGLESSNACWKGNLTTQYDGTIASADSMESVGEPVNKEPHSLVPDQTTEVPLDVDEQFTTYSLPSSTGSGNHGELVDGDFSANGSPNWPPLTTIPLNNEAVESIAVQRFQISPEKKRRCSRSI